MRTILVVEDEPGIARVVEDYLARAGFRVVAAATAADALAAARSARPALVVLDLGLPDADGLDVTRELRRVANVPIVMLTARGDVSDRIRGIDSGVNAYLAKPFSSKELISTVRAQLQSQEASAELLLEQKLDSLQTLAGGRS